MATRNMTNENTADGYAMEKFSLAVSALAEGQGSLQHRLASAYVYHLVHCGEARLPADRRAAFRELEAAMRVKSDPQRGSAAASAELLTDDEARRHAEFVVSTAFWLHRTWWLEQQQ